MKEHIGRDSRGVALATHNTGSTWPPYDQKQVIESAYLLIIFEEIEMLDMVSMSVPSKVMIFA